MYSSSYLFLYSYTFTYCIRIVLSQYAAPQQFAHLLKLGGVSSELEAIQHYLGTRRHVQTSYSIHLRETDCLTLENGKDRLSRNVGNYEPTLRNIPEEWISQVKTLSILRMTWIIYKHPVRTAQ
jgi:hypothetical protein